MIPSKEMLKKMKSQGWEFVTAKTTIEIQSKVHHKSRKLKVVKFGSIAIWQNPNS